MWAVDIYISIQVIIDLTLDVTAVENPKGAFQVEINVSKNITDINIIISLINNIYILTLLY